VTPERAEQSMGAKEHEVGSAGQLERLERRLGGVSNAATPAAVATIHTA
jgi:hypothetical protein